ncbi:RNA ligase-domain-containing protein [Phlyctochytrium arcticum]|nr:RNA ligase-domain-containing protein [Phlyctochytrium arcticum]
MTKSGKNTETEATPDSLTKEFAELLLNSPSSVAPVEQLVREYEALSSGRRAPVRVVQYKWVPKEKRESATDGRVIYSYKCSEGLFRKDPPVFPTLARGLFMTNLGSVFSPQWKIVARGYDKFFNIGEVATTKWEYLTDNTQSPYEVTLKENGCIIFVAALEGDLVVTSKHAIDSAPGSSGTTDKPTHARKGEEWLERHLAASGRTRKEFQAFLHEKDVTAVFELADDDFEEHILEYPPDRRGLYLHGINHNVREFVTWDSAKVKDVASRFGFKSVDSLVFDTIQEVQSFTDECRTSGSYEGRAIEGFVVRCKSQQLAERCVFFKIKYEDPYLMFREWREITNWVIAGKKRKFKPRFQLTRQYVDWVEKKLKSDPEMFDQYTQQKGIIAARNLFLKEAGLEIGGKLVTQAKRTTEEYARGEATMKTEEEKEADEAILLEGGNKKNTKSKKPEPMLSAQTDPNFGSHKIMLLTVAVVGAGKTLLGRLLAELYGIGHIQNDNITGKNAFGKNVMSEFTRNDIVYCDRNNQLFQHRQDLTEKFKSAYPGGKIYALDWGIEDAIRDKGFPAVMNILAKRVLERGENHQSLTPQRTQDFRAVIANFLKTRDRLDIDTEADAHINQIVSLRLEDSVHANLSRIVTLLCLEMPTQERFDSALQNAIAHKETVIKKVKDTSGKRDTSYYAVRIDPTFDLEGLLSEVFAKEPPGKANFWRSLKDSNRVSAATSKGWHITLVPPMKAGKPTDREQDLRKLYANRIAKYLEDPNAKTFRVATHADRGFPVDFEMTDVVWDDRVMCIVVGSLPPDIQHINSVPHITVATTSDAVKNVISNEVLASSSDTINRLKLRSKVRVTGEVCKFRY